MHVGSSTAWKPWPYLVSLGFMVSASACGSRDTNAEDDPGAITKGDFLDDGGETETSGGGASHELPEATPDQGRDVLAIDMVLDLAGFSGIATVEVVPSEGSSGLTLDVGGLEIIEVTAQGRQLSHRKDADKLHIGVPAQTADITIEYAFVAGSDFDGWRPQLGISFLWPYHCGNLYPCKADPSDGYSVTMAVDGVPDNLTAVYPESIPLADPGYMPAVAVGEYEEIVLPPTSGGTAISVWHLSGHGPAARTGARNLSAAFDFLEQTYGAYRYGNHVASVEAAWGPGAFGGME